MPDEEAREVFKQIRWAETNGEPVYPVCGRCESYYLATQRRWKCKARECGKQYSLTSGTIFHPQDGSAQILAAIVRLMCAC